MKKVFAIFALLLAFAVCARAADVTIQPATIPNANFTGIADAFGVCSVNNGSAVVTSSNAFAINWVGIGGFQATIAGVRYTVASVQSRSQLTLTTAYVGSSNPSAAFTLHKYVLLRVYALQRFTPAGATFPVQVGDPRSGQFYKQAACSVISDGATATLYIPTLTLPSTTDAQNPNERGATYFAGFYTPGGGRLKAYDCFESFALREVPTTTTWAAICQFNNPGGGPPPERDAYAKSQTYSRSEIEALLTGGQGGYRFVQDDGAPLTQRGTLNFIGSALTATDDPGNLRTNVVVDEDLNALASNNSNGFWARTGPGSGLALTLLGTANRITVTNGGGTGNPVFDVGSDVVTIAGSQTLTNKTLTTPTIGSFVNAAHGHENAAGGGTLNAGNVFSAGSVPLARGGTGTFLADPGAHAVWVWDDTDNAVKLATIGSGLSYNPATDTLSATGGSLTVREEDGSPNVSGVTEIRVSNGTLTNNGAGSVSVATGGGGGGGMAIGGSITGGATVGSVLFVDSGAILGQDSANLFYDNPNNRLGLGTNSPLSLLHLASSGTTTITLDGSSGASSVIQMSSTALTIAVNSTGDDLKFNISNAAPTAYTILSTGESLWTSPKRNTSTPPVMYRFAAAADGDSTPLSNTVNQPLLRIGGDSSGGAVTQTFTGAGSALQTQVLIKAPTYSGAGNYSTTASFAIEDKPNQGVERLAFLVAAGESRFGGSVDMDANLTVDNTLSVGGGASVVGLITGDSGASIDVLGTSVTIGFATSPGAYLDVTGQFNDVYFNFARAVNFTAGSAIPETANFLVDRATYNADGARTLTVAATAKFVGAPIASTNITITTPVNIWNASGNMLLGTPSSASSNLRMANSSNGNIFSLAPSAFTSSYTWTLPTGLPGSTQCVTVDTGGAMSYGACSGGSGSPGGASGSIQINNAGSFGSISGSSVDANGLVTLSPSTSTTNAVVNVQTWKLNSSGTAAGNFGQGLLGQLESSTTNDRDAFRLQWSWVNAADGDRTSESSIWLTRDAESLRDYFSIRPRDTAIGADYVLGPIQSPITTGGITFDLYSGFVSGSNIGGSSVALVGGLSTGTGVPGHPSIRYALQSTTGGTGTNFGDLFVYRIPSTQWTKTNTTTVSNTTSLTAVTGTTFPGGGPDLLTGGFLQVGRTITVEMDGFFAWTSTPNLTVGLRLDDGASPTTLVSLVAALPSPPGVNVSLHCRFVATVRTFGASGTGFAQGFCDAKTVSGTVTTYAFQGANTGTFTEDLTVDQTVVPFVQWSALSASNTVSITNLVVRIDN